MASPILSSRARITAVKGETLLRCYAARSAPKEAAEVCALSLNTIYLQYGRIRDRLIAVGYYRDWALSLEEAGLRPEIVQALRERRGIPEDEVYPHAAELIEWAEEWPPKIVFKHLCKIIELTGPLGAPFDLTEAEYDKLRAYVRYARTNLIHDRAAASDDTSEFQLGYIARAKEALETEWQAYRAASKRVERDRPPHPKSRKKR